MKNTYTATAEIEIIVPPEKVWEAFTNPDIVKEYLFGTKVESNWEEGSSIVYTGEWEGKEYHDKGTVVKVIPNQLLVTTYWSSMAGTSDSPENYKNVTYEITPIGDTSKVTITQDNEATQEDAEHSTKNWQTVLEAMKKVLEK